MPKLEGAAFELVVPTIIEGELSDFRPPADNEVLHLHGVTEKAMRCAGLIMGQGKPFYNRQHSPWHWDDVGVGGNLVERGKCKTKFVGLPSNIIRTSDLPVYVDDPTLLERLNSEAVTAEAGPKDLLVCRGFRSRVAILHDYETTEFPRLSLAFQIHV